MSPELEDEALQGYSTNSLFNAVFSRMPEDLREKLTGLLILSQNSSSIEPFESLYKMTLKLLDDAVDCWLDCENDEFTAEVSSLETDTTT